MMKSGTTELGIAERFVAGSMAGVFSQTAIYPLEVCWRTYFHLAVDEDDVSFVVAFVGGVGQ